MSPSTSAEVKAAVEQDMAQWRLEDVAMTVRYAINSLPGYKTVHGAIELHAVSDETGHVTIVTGDGRRYDLTIQERPGKR